MRLPNQRISGEMEKAMNNRRTCTGRSSLSTLIGLAPIAMLGLSAAPAAANINLELRPTFQTVWYQTTDPEVEVGLYAVSDDDTTQYSAAIQAIIQWDPDFLTLLGHHGAGAVPLAGSSFPMPDPFGLNEAVPPQDGDGMYVALAPLGAPLGATPEGVLIQTFVFEPLQYSPGTPVNIGASAGDPPGETIVFDGEVAGLDVTGTLSGCLIQIIPCCPPDLDYNCVVDVVDFLILLAQWGTNPGGPPDLDGNGDVGVNDFLLLLAAWGPCPGYE
jgi:hypothetical protein